MPPPTPPPGVGRQRARTVSGVPTQHPLASLQPLTQLPPVPPPSGAPRLPSATTASVRTGSDGLQQARVTRGFQVAPPLAVPPTSSAMAPSGLPNMPGDAEHALRASVGGSASGRRRNSLATDLSALSLAPPPAPPTLSPSNAPVPHRLSWRQGTPRSPASPPSLRPPTRESGARSPALSASPSSAPAYSTSLYNASRLDARMNANQDALRSYGAWAREGRSGNMSASSDEEDYFTSAYNRGTRSAGITRSRPWPWATSPPGASPSPNNSPNTAKASPTSPDSDVAARAKRRAPLNYDRLLDAQRRMREDQECAGMFDRERLGSTGAKGPGGELLYPAPILSQAPSPSHPLSTAPPGSVAMSHSLSSRSGSSAQTQATLTRRGSRAGGGTGALVIPGSSVSNQPSPRAVSSSDIPPRRMQLSPPPGWSTHHRFSIAGGEQPLSPSPPPSLAYTTSPVPPRLPSPPVGLLRGIPIGRRDTPATASAWSTSSSLSSSAASDTPVRRPP